MRFLPLLGGMGRGEHLSSFSHHLVKEERDGRRMFPRPSCINQLDIFVRQKCIAGSLLHLRVGILYFIIMDKTIKAASVVFAFFVLPVSS